MHHDIQKVFSYHNIYLFFPICKRKEFKLFQLLESFKKKSANAPSIYEARPCFNKATLRDCKKFTWNALFMDLSFIIHHHNHNFNRKSCNHRYPGLSIGFACTCRSCPAYLGTESRNYRAYFVYRSSKGHLWVYANGDHFFVVHPSFHCAKEIKGTSMYFWSVSLTGQQSH